MVSEEYDKNGSIIMSPPRRLKQQQNLPHHMYIRQQRKSLLNLLFCILVISLLRYFRHQNTVVEKVQTASHVILLWNDQLHEKMRQDNQWGTVQCGCLITSLRNYSVRPFDAIVFNADDPYSLQGLDTVNRHPHYLSVFAALQPLSYVDESVLQYAPGTFNLTMTYRRDSDVVWNQYYMSPKRMSEDSVAFLKLLPLREVNALREKDRFAFYILYDVNERTYSQSTYLEQLRKHITLEATESCSVFNNCGCYHFMLIFEPSFCPDYMHPDIYVALNNHVVPVLIGGNNITDHVPTGSFIHSRDFASAAQLAEHLVQVMNNPKLYEQYFNWHLYYDLQYEDQPYCKLCHRVRRLMWHPQAGQQRNDFDRWWTQRQCPSRSNKAELY